VLLTARRVLLREYIRHVRTSRQLQRIVSWQQRWNLRRFRGAQRLHRYRSIAQIPLGSSRLDTTRLDTFDVSSPCIFGLFRAWTARHDTRHDELDSLDTTSSTAWLDTFDTTSAAGVTRNLVCCVICIKLWYVSYSLIYWSRPIHINLIYFLFDGTNRICVCKSIKTTKLVQASTIAFSSSAMLEQHGSTRSFRLARHVERVETWRDEPSGIWAYTIIIAVTYRLLRHKMQHEHIIRLIRQYNGIEHNIGYSTYC